MNTNTENLGRTLYFGLSVEVVHSMETCSLIRFSGHEVTVDACDLVAEPGIQIGPMELVPQTGFIQGRSACPALEPRSYNKHKIRRMAFMPVSEYRTRLHVGQDNGKRLLRPMEAL